MALRNESPLPPADEEISAVQGGKAYLTDIERHLRRLSSARNWGSGPWRILKFQYKDQS